MVPPDRGAPGGVVVPVAVGASLGVALVVGAWSTVGPAHVLFPLLVTCAWSGLAAIVGPGVAVLLPRRWFHVSAAELRRHRRWGVGAFDRALELAGWNSVVRTMRGTSGPVRRSDLGDLQDHVRAAMAGHGVGVLAHLVVVVACLLVGAWGSAGVTTAAGVLLHGWPVLLQRSTSARIQRLRSLDPVG